MANTEKNKSGIKKFWAQNKNRRRTYIIGALIAIFIIDSSPTLALRGLVVSTIDYVAGKTLYTNLSSTQERANEKALATVPEWTKDMFFAQGGTITVVDELDCIGSYNNSTKVIKIKDTGFFKNASLPHELGHYVDHTLGELSTTNEFTEIAEEELDDFTASKALIQLNHKYLENSHEATGRYSEYFADTFGTYCMEPLLLKATAPKTYEYMKNLCNR